MGLTSMTGPVANFIIGVACGGALTAALWLGMYVTRRDWIASLPHAGRPRTDPTAPKAAPPPDGSPRLRSSHLSRGV